MNIVHSTDFYKVGHAGQYPEGTQYVYSNGTARSFKYAQTDSFTVFGIQAFLYKRLIEGFGEFFASDKDTVVKKYQRRMDNALGNGVVSADNIAALHDLGYLPLRIKALPEGVSIGPGIPYVTIQNTRTEFFWLTNYIETMLSCEVWQPMTTASVARAYRKLLLKYAEETGTPSEFVAWQAHDFSMRGMPGIEAANASGAAHLAAGNFGTDTVGAIDYLEDYYFADSDKEIVGGSVVATEHAVMCMGTKDDEIGTFRRLIQKYDTGVLSIVSDTWDLWKVLTEYAPALKAEIESRKPVILDSGEVVAPAKVVFRPDCYDSETKVLTPRGWVYFKNLNKGDLVAQVLEDNSYEFVSPMKIVNQEYSGDMYHYTDNFGKVDLLVTPNHRMILEQTQKTGLSYTRVVTADKLLKIDGKGNAHQKFWRSAKAQELGKEFSPLERLKLAFQADGSYVTKSITSIRFSFSKQRKCDRLEEILGKLPYEWKKYTLTDGRYEYHIKVEDCSIFEKSLSWVNTSELSYSWCVDFVEELSYWDATRRSDDRIKFDTTTPCVIPIIELVALSAGYGVLVSHSEDDRSDKFSDVYTMHIMKNNKIGGQAIRKALVPYQGTVHCVQVPTGNLLVKRGKGTMVCGNSGDPVKILTGYTWCTEADLEDDSVYEAVLEGTIEVIKYGDGTYYEVSVEDGWSYDLGEQLTEHEVKGVVELLWDTFGGEVNSKGFKQLLSVGAIYGDSITLDRADQIMARLRDKGFASGNVVLGIGSYTYQYNTRDTYGQAIKATYGVVDNVPREIFKDPVTDDGTKKSAKGLLRVELENGRYVLYDQQTPDQENEGELKTVFLDGKVTRTTTLAEIRERANA